MAGDGLPSGNHPQGSTNGALAGQPEGIGPVSRPIADDQTLADRDQTLADADQTAADADQAAADSDQAASDRDLAQGGDPVEHDFTREIRDRGARQRQETARTRVDTAAARDAIAEARDMEAAARDEAAARKDRELAARTAGPRRPERRVIGVLLRAAERRSGAAAMRAAAAEFRALAAADRERAAWDREQAGADRRQAQLERGALLDQLAAAETDQLTGARTRAAGLVELEREIDRARRTTGRLVVGYVDVVGLKAVNDAHGHAAGDALLKHAVHAIREHLRSYDLIVRMGGDEFLCVLSGATIETALHRFDAIQTELEAESDPCAIRVGVAALRPADSVAELIEHADAELPTGSRRSALGA